MGLLTGGIAINQAVGLLTMVSSYLVVSDRVATSVNSSLAILPAVVMAIVQLVADR